MSDFLEFVSYVFVVSVTIAATIFLMLFLWGLGPERWSCEALSKQTGLQASYNVWSTCMLKMPNGEFITKDAYQEVMKKKLEVTIKQ